MNKPMPTINPLIKIGLERFLSEIESATFISREYNHALPALIIEMLRILKEVRP
jgi:hypothetical protein